MSTVSTDGRGKGLKVDLEQCTDEELKTEWKAYPSELKKLNNNKRQNKDYATQKKALKERREVVRTKIEDNVAAAFHEKTGKTLESETKRRKKDGAQLENAAAIVQSLGTIVQGLKESNNGGAEELKDASKSLKAIKARYFGEEAGKAASEKAQKAATSKEKRAKKRKADFEADPEKIAQLERTKEVKKLEKEATAADKRAQKSVAAATAAAEKAEEEKAAVDKAVREKAEKAEQEKAAADKAREKAEKAAQEKEATDETAREKAEKTAQEKATEKAAPEKEATDKTAQEKAEKAAAEKAAQEKRAANKAAQETAAVDKAAQEKEAADKAAQEKEAAEKAAQEKEAAEEAAQEKEAADKAAREKAAAERQHLRRKQLSRQHLRRQQFPGFWARMGKSVVIIKRQIRPQLPTEDESEEKITGEKAARSSDDEMGEMESCGSSSERW